MVYCWLLACEMSPLPGWQTSIGKWCEAVWNSIDQAVLVDLRAANGGAATRAIWAGLMIHVAGTVLARPAWVDSGANMLANLCQRQQSSGAFLQATASDNPETLWYHELILLHAVASYAARSGDSSATRAAQRSAEFHLNETQPDHATAQPWGLPAFVRYTPMLADQVLHAMATQHPGAIEGLSAMLLADTLCGVRRGEPVES